MSDTWQPIATAPKDTDINSPLYRVLLQFPDGEVSVAYWDKCCNHSGMLAWIEPCSWEQLADHYGSPTHWMPLPQPPEKP